MLAAKTARIYRSSFQFHWNETTLSLFLSPLSHPLVVEIFQTPYSAVLRCVAFFTSYPGKNKIKLHMPLLLSQSHKSFAIEEY